MKIVNPLHNLLLWISGLLFLAAFFTLKKTLDIHFSSIVYVVPFSRIFMFGAVFLSLLWLLYTFTSRRLFSKKLYKVHIIGTVVLMVIVLIASLWSNQLIHYYSGNNSIQEMQISAHTGNSIVAACILLTSIQLLYLLNLIIGLFTNKKA